MATELAARYPEMVKFHRRLLDNRIAQNIANDEATVEVHYYEFYMKLLEYWFPASRGWNVAQEPRLANGTRPDFLVSIRTNEAGQPTTGWVDAEGTRTVVVVETKRPSNHWTDAGRANIMNEVEEYMEHEIDQHELNVIWGITMIGYHWKGVKRAEPGEGLENCTEWADDIMSPESWAQMRAFKNQITGEVMPA